MASQPLAVTRFIDAVERRFNRDHLDSFWQCEKAFRALIATDFAQELLQRDLQALLADPAHRGEWRPNQRIVFGGGLFNLAVTLLTEARRYIHTTPFHAMYAPIGTACLDYDVYRLPDDFRQDLFDPGQRLTYAGSGRLAPKDVLRLDGIRYAYDFKMTEPVLTATFYTASFHTMEWLFSKDSLYAWQANDGEISSTQIRVACNLLGRLAHQSSLEPLLLMTKHPHHSVRWAAIQNLGRLDRAAAVKALEEAQADPHPHVATAAVRTLQQITGQRK